MFYTYRLYTYIKGEISYDFFRFFFFFLFSGIWTLVTLIFFLKIRIEVCFYLKKDVLVILTA